MCGISGFFGKGGQTEIDRMTDALSHRGPDGRGTWTDPTGSLYLGHRRLSIIDLESGAQPMATADGELVITFNGEIYNHAELRAELEREGHRFLTDHSDTEVLLYAYRQWGEAMHGRLNGMWAFAIYDRKKQSLFLSRDRFGKKPLYYTRSEGFFGFASELSALREHPAVKTAVSELALQKFFAYAYIPAPRTIYENIFKLPAGHCLRFSLRDQETRIQQYWEYLLEPFETVPADAEEQWGEELIRLLDQAVKRRLVSDVPLGVFLSGGIDSSLVSSLAAKHLGEPLQTFCIGFEEESFDESDHAQTVARAIGSEHWCETLSLEKSVALLPEIVSRLDEPIGDSSLLPTYLVSGIARKRVTVALGGDGGDELFAGYDPFQALSKAALYERLVPRPVHRAISLLAGRLPVSHSNLSLDFKIKRTLGGLSYPSKLWCPVWMGPLPPQELDKLFEKRLDPEEVYSEAIEAWESCPQDNLVDRATQFFVRLYLQDDILTKVDRASMMHGLEVRAPFLDIDLVDFVRRLPPHFKLRGTTSKYLLKKAAAGLIPESIAQRPKKGFGSPIGPWFRSGLLKIQHDPALPALSKTRIESLIEAHLGGKSDQRLFLWNYWILSRMQLS